MLITEILETKKHQVGNLCLSKGVTFFLSQIEKHHPEFHPL